MIYRSFRIYTILLTAVLMLVTAQYLIFDRHTKSLNNQIVETEKEMLSQKALSISLATYARCRTYLQEYGDTGIISYLLEVGESNRDREIEDIRVANIDSNADGSVTVRIKITDRPESETVFHEMRFEKKTEKWRLVEFGVDI